VRGEIPNLQVARPIGLSLPAVYLDDDLTQRLTRALDEVLAPVLLTLDCLSYYFDPETCPPDMLDWLAGWVALTLDETWTVERRRALIGMAVELHRWRGTRHGLLRHLQLLTGGQVRVTDSGGCTWSAESGGPLPGQPEPYVEILVRPDRRLPVSDRWLRAAVAEAVPAHVPFTIMGAAVGRARVGGS
jgi:phage tail-like protein